MKNRNRDGSLKNVGERGFLKQFLPSLASLSAKRCFVPPGDDAAVLRSPGRPVLSIDGLTEGTHFKSTWARRVKKITGRTLGYLLAWKLLGCSLSDLAAMGGADHRWAMIYLGAPGNLSLRFLRDFYKGTKDASKRWNCTLAGGDTVRAKDVSLVAAVGGSRASGRFLTRTGARAGDLLCVAGTIGDASIGLEVLEGKKKLNRAAAAYFIRRFFVHEPMFHAADVLREEEGVTSLIDLSDSLSESVHLLCEASKVGANVELDFVPVSRPYASLFQRNVGLLSGGEDYGLLFTVSRQGALRLRKKIKFAVIGEMARSKEGVRFSKSGQPLPAPRFFEHYG